MDSQKQITRTGIAYGYIRVSDLKQVASGLSLEAQREQVRAYYEYRLKPEGIAWGNIFEDHAASAFKKRLIMRKAGAALDLRLRERDHVIITKIDRGFRNTKDMLDTMERWQKRGIGLHFLDMQLDTTTTNGRLIATITAAVAEAESARKRERQLEANAAKRARGEAVPGHPGYGWKVENKRKVPDQLERAFMAAILWMRDVDQLSFGEIARRFLAERVTYKPGKEWSVDRVRRAYRAAHDLKLTPNNAIFSPRQAG